MLTDLSFLDLGQQWPPLSEFDRLDKIRKNKAIFKGEHAIIYEEAFKRIERVIGNFQEIVSYPIIINYQKLVTLKLADLLWGEQPKIVAGEHDSAEQKSVEAISANVDLQNTGYMATIDLSRFGDGPLIVYKDGEKGMIDVTQACFWFPVVDRLNLRRFVNHVLAWEYVESGSRYLHVQVHYVGFYIERTYLLEGAAELSSFRIKAVHIPDKRVETGLNDFAVVPVPNVLTSDSVYGMDDYSDIDSIISELLVRVSQISRILDKHADPSLTGPMSALERDPVTGEYKFKKGNYIIRDGKDDAEAKYLVWDAQLEANFKQIELLINSLHAISEVGSALLGDKGDENGGSAPSGTSLRFRLISPLAKARRVAMRFRPALIKAIKLCSQLGGEGVKDLSKVPISVTFMDGLPNDEMEQAQIMALRTANKATMSIQTALTKYDGLTSKDAETELEKIQEEEEAMNPMLSISTPFNGDNKPKETT